MNFTFDQFWKILYVVEWPNKFKEFRKHMASWKIPKWEMWTTIWHFYQITNNDKNNNLWINIENFEPIYEVDPDKKQVLETLENQIKAADTVFVFADADFEWSVISYSMYDYFKKYKDKFIRIEFTDFDVKSILNAIEKRTPSYHEWAKRSWQARAVLDKIIWYWYSPIVRKKTNGLKQVSAWRVQSISLKMLAERELEISNHSISNYYTLWATNNKIGKAWHIWNKQKLEWWKFNFPKEEADRILEKIKWETEATVISYEEWKRTRKPRAPFRDTTFQIEGSSILKMSTKRLMDLWNKMVDAWFCSYVRSDSIVLQDEKIDKIREILKNDYEESFFPWEAIEYTNWKWAQEWHYWIAPINFDITPEFVEKAMGKDWKEAALIYNLVWRRAVSSQMSPARYDTQKLVLDIKGEQFTIRWEKMTFEWFLKVYNFREDDSEEENSKWFQSFKEWEKINISKITTEEHKTQPKPRFKEVSLVKALADAWIWRPSTRPWIIPNLSSKTKQYIELIWDKKNPKIKVTEKWMAVYEALKDFTEKDILNIKFTSEMEDKIEGLSKLNWKKAADEWYFKLMTEMFAPIKNVMDENWVSFWTGWNFWSWDFEKKYSDILDPLGNQKDQFLVIRNSAHWKYYNSELSWANYPNSIKILEEKCPKCNNLLIEADSKAWNKYVFCSASKVKIWNDAWINICDYFNSGWGKKWEDTWVKCPECWKGTIEEKETSKWLIQICSTWQSCSFFNFLWKIERTWEECPKCWGELIIKELPSGKKRKDCINRRYNTKKKINEGCTNEWEWYND